MLHLGTFHCYTHLCDELKLNIYARAGLIFLSLSLVQYAVLVLNVMPQMRALSLEKFREGTHDELT
jgi:hypothetical protein